VTIDGEPWIVLRSQRWRGFGAEHYENVIGREVTP
jgi:hypothetical protein